MKKFSLLQLLPALDSGGVEQGTVDLANFIGQSNLGSFVVSKGGKMESQLDRKTTKHITLPANTKNLFYMPFVANKLSKIIHTHNIDIVHVRSRAPAWLLQFINKKKFISVSTFHNIYGTDNFLKKYYNKSLGKVDHIIAISQYVKSQIINLYGLNENSIDVIHRGIDTEHFNPDNNNQNDIIRFLKKYEIPNDKKIILYPGRLTDWKGQINFLQIVENYKDDKLMFYFVGDDKNKSYHSKLVREIKNKNLSHICKIFGNLSKQDIKIMYFLSDLIISAPLKPEGFGRVISESLAMKKIILSYNFGGAKEQLKNLDNIFKITPKDQKELKIKIDKVLEFSKENISNIGNESRNHIINNFSKKKMLENYFSFYNSILL